MNLPVATNKNYMNIYKERLVKVVEHLEKGVLGHKEFNFSVINNGKDGTCGSQGCALGELPIIFPEAWRFNINDVFSGGICLIRTEQYDFFPGLNEWFGIDYHEAKVLFYDNSYLDDKNKELRDKIGMAELNKSASKEQVAANMRIFIKWKYPDCALTDGQ